MMTRPFLFVATLLSSLGLNDLKAQGVRVSNTGADSASAAAGTPIILADTTFYSLFYEVGPREGTGDLFDPTLQVEEYEPGNFILGAFVGGALVYLWIEQDPGTRASGIMFVPVGALIGGVLFWTIGIG